MVAVNAEPAVKANYNPIHHVTAIFESRDSLPSIVRSLRDAGFAEEEIIVFLGEEGAEKLDLKAKNAGAVFRFFKDLKLALSDETEIHDILDRTLRNGGMTVHVFTDTDDAKKRRASDILKAHQATDVRYWGNLSIERM